MKIRTYFIKNYILAILLFMTMYSIFGYCLFISKEYLGVLCMGIASFWILNRRIILYEDKIVVYNGFRRTKIEVDFVKRLKIGDYRPALSRDSIPTIFVNMKNDEKKRIYYNSYSRESIAEIIEHALKKNKNIKLDTNTKALIRNTESEYDIKIRKREKMTVVLMIISIVATIIIFIFRK